MVYDLLLNNHLIKIKFVKIIENIKNNVVAYKNETLFCCLNNIILCIKFIVEYKDYKFLL